MAEIVALNDKRLLIYRNGKLHVAINIKSRGNLWLYKLSGRRVLISMRKRLCTHVYVLSLNTLEITEIYRANYHTDIKQYDITLYDNMIISDASSNNYHINERNDVIISDEVLSGSFPVLDINGHFHGKTLDEYATSRAFIVAKIDDLIIHHDFCYLWLTKGDANIKWSLNEIFNYPLDDICKHHLRITAFTTQSMVVVGCIYVKNGNANISLIRILAPKGDNEWIDAHIETYVITDIPKTVHIYIRQVDDYGMLIEISAAGNKSWIYQSRTIPITYRGIGCVAVMNHEAYLDSIKQEVMNSDYVYDVLKAIINSYL